VFWPQMAYYKIKDFEWYLSNIQNQLISIKITFAFLKVSEVEKILMGTEEVMFLILVNFMSEIEAIISSTYYQVPKTN